MDEKEITEHAEEYVLEWLNSEIEYLDTVESLADEGIYEDEIVNAIYARAQAIALAIFQNYRINKVDFR